MPILDSVCDAVGKTPMVRLARVGRGLPCELLGKCEFLNPGGSVKDRIGVRMIDDAEAAGRIKPGDTLIEPTSGNTGIGLALAGAVKGYRVIVTMPEKMSQEKQVILEALGAEIIRTPTEAPWDAPESHIGVAKRLHEILPRSHILDQYQNPSNPDVHAEETGQEILEQCDGHLDAIVMGAGTGGTITGVARTLKAALPSVRVIGVDPEGSILAGPGPVRPYKVEGIGYDFIPEVLDVALVDQWVKTRDAESFQAARRLIRTEGLLVGGSSGSALHAALQVGATMAEGQRMVVLLPDSVRNYMTKFVDDLWMRQNGFSQAAWELMTVGALLDQLPRRRVISCRVEQVIGDVVDHFREHGISQMPVEDGGRLVGIITESDVLRHLVASRDNRRSTVAELMVRSVSTVAREVPAGELPRIFERGEVAIVTGGGDAIVGLVTKMDLIDFLGQRRLP